MSRFALAAITAVALSACASTPPKPPTPAEMLVSGPWACESAVGPGTIKTKQTYRPDGTTAFDLAVSGGASGMTVEASGSGEAKWALLEGDTKLQLTLGALNVTKANLNGADIAPAIAQAMIGPYIAGQSATSAIAITPTTMTLTATDATTNCTRVPKA